MFSLKSLILSKRGAAMANVLAASSLLAVISTSVIMYTKNASKSSKKNQAELEAELYTAQLRNLLADSSSCITTMASNNIEPSAGQRTINSFRRWNIVNSGLETSYIIGNLGANFVELESATVTGNYNSYVIRLVFEENKHDADNNKRIYKEVPITVTLSGGGSGSVTDCTIRAVADTRVMPAIVASRLNEINQAGCWFLGGSYDQNNITCDLSYLTNTNTQYCHFSGEPCNGTFSSVIYSEIQTEVESEAENLLDATRSSLCDHESGSYDRNTDICHKGATRCMYDERGICRAI